jgi:hypothetical protein
LDFTQKDPRSSIEKYVSGKKAHMNSIKEHLESNVENFNKNHQDVNHR